MKAEKIPPAAAELLGGSVLLLPLVAGVLAGSQPADLLFNRVLTTLSLSLWMRPYHFLIFTLGILSIVGTGAMAVKYRHPQELSPRVIYLRLLLYLFSGYLVITWVLHWLLDDIFYRGAFVTFRFVIGTSLLSVLLVQLVIDRWEFQGNVTRWRTYGKVARYTVLILLSLLIITPTLVPMSGVLAEPGSEVPDFGAEQGPYDVSRTRLDNAIPANISSYLLPDNDNSSWYSFVYHPQNAEGRSLPLVLFAHGYTGTDPEDYENTFYQLASQGAVVVYTQYATEIELRGDYTEPEGTNFTASNAMYFRYLMTWGGMGQAVDQMQSSNYLSGTLDTSYLLIIGHSTGGGMVPYLATKAVEKGWGSEMLILDLETPWFAGSHPELRYDLELLPPHTMVNIAGSEDDHLASPCIGMQQFELFRRYLTEDNLAYLVNPSDRHGFPRMVATHYLITSRINDHLTLWGYLKRVDAMVVMLAGHANNDPVNLASYFLGGGSAMTYQGTWSDGTPVNQLLVSTDPFGIRGGEDLASRFAVDHDYAADTCSL